MELFDRIYALHRELDAAHRPIPVKTLAQRPIDQTPTAWHELNSYAQSNACSSKNNGVADDKL